MFAENLCPPITKDRGGNELQRNIEVAEQYVKSGQALKFYYGFSSRYYDKYINDSRIRLESNSSVCLRVTCLEGSSLDREGIVKILRSERITSGGDKRPRSLTGKTFRGIEPPQKNLLIDKIIS